MPALLALVAVTAVWGYTFVPMKDAVAVYPLFAFLAVRFAIAAAVLAVPAAPRLRGLGRRGWLAGTGLGLLLALGYALQTAGLERTTVSSAGFITGLYVVFTPLLGLVLFRTRVGGAVAFTQAEMVAAFLGFALVAAAVGQVEVPRGWTVWSALLVTGIFASALGFLVQTWAQRRTSATRTALAFALEPVWAGLFGFWLAGDRLGALGWGGGAVIMAGILVAEPEAARTLRRLVPAVAGGARSP
jgi:drug/metabolite transporter (DMT)-like permease